MSLEISTRTERPRHRRLARMLVGGFAAVAMWMLVGPAPAEAHGTVYQVYRNNAERVHNYAQKHPARFLLANGANPADLWAAAFVRDNHDHNAHLKRRAWLKDRVKLRREARADNYGWFRDRVRVRQQHRHDRVCRH